MGVSVTQNSCEPRWATGRTSARSTRGGEVATVAKELGVDPLPWQRQVLDTALEVREDGRPAFKNVIVSVPRQQGKSAGLCFPLIVDRMLSEPGCRIAFSEQTRLAARAMLLESFWPRLQSSSLGEGFSVSKAWGAEKLRHENGSIMSLVSITTSSMHGSTLDLVICDEVWSWGSAAIEQALQPATVTRPKSQVWMLSTAGDARAEFWQGKVLSAREVVERGVIDGLCLFEWSADPHAAAADPEVWRGCMPSLGVLTDEETIAAALLAMGEKEFRRAFLNLAEDKRDDGWGLIDRDAWARARGWAVDRG